MVHNMQFLVKYVYFFWNFDGIPHKIRILITESVNIYMYLSICKVSLVQNTVETINNEISHEKA